MSWLLIVILILTAFSVVQGIRKGLIRSVVSTFFMIFAVAIAVLIVPYLDRFLDEYSQLPEYIQKKCEVFLQEELADVLGEDMLLEEISQQNELIGQLPLPESMKKVLVENNTQEMYHTLVADTFGEYLAKYLSELILNLLSFAIAFVLAVIILQIILKVVDFVMELPVLGFVNQLGGAAAGLIRAFLWLWVFFALLPLIGSTELGSICIEEIGKSPFLFYLYTHNLLLEILL